MDNAHVLQAHVQLIGDDLAQNSVDSLAHRVAAGVEHYFSGIVELYASIFPGSEPAGLDETTDADADGAAFFSCGRASGLQPLIADALERALELARVIAGVVDHKVERMRAIVIGHLFGTYEVASPHVGWVEIEPASHQIHHPLTHKISFVAPGAAIGSDRRLVGKNTENIAAVIFDPVWTAQDRRRGNGWSGAVGAGIRAHIEQNFRLHGDNSPVLFDADLDPMSLLSRLVGGLQMLRAILNPTNRPAESHRGEGNQEILRIELPARAKSTTHLGFNKMNRALGQIEEVRQNAPVGMRHLCRSPHREHA